jgi:hypothetical protein
MKFLNELSGFTSSEFLATCISGNTLLSSSGLEKKIIYVRCYVHTYQWAGGDGC